MLLTMTKPLALALCLLLAPSATAQTPESDVLDAVDALFDAMRAGDSTAVRAAFVPGADLRTVLEREGMTQLRDGTVDAFVEAVGRPHEQVWDERTWDEAVRVDGLLASAWVPYAFYLGDVLSHCGTNAFQFVRQDGRWQITSIIDTRYPAKACEVPDEVIRDS